MASGGRRDDTGGATGGVEEKREEEGDEALVAESLVSGDSETESVEPMAPLRAALVFGLYTVEVRRRYSRSFRIVKCNLAR